MTVDYNKAVFIFVQLIIVNFNEAVSVCAIKAYGGVPVYMLNLSTECRFYMSVITLGATLYHLSCNLG